MTARNYRQPIIFIFIIIAVTIREVIGACPSDPNCNSCPTTGCDQCKVFYGQNLSTKKCEACSTQSNCYLCNTTTKCQTCISSSYGPNLESPGCGLCGANCARCSTAGAGKCDLCASTYYMDSTGICTKCQLTNCAMCNSTRCLNCITGYSLIDPQQCIPCSANCTFCRNAGANSCDYGRCIAGYGSVVPPPITCEGPPQMNQLLTVVPNISQQFNFVLFGGKLYSIYDLNPGVGGIKIHDALTGSFLGVTSTPGVYNFVKLAICHKNSQLFISGGSHIWYADISQLQPNSNATWQKLTWSGEMYKTQGSVIYFEISDDCEEVFVLFGDLKLQVRKLIDGAILASRQSWGSLRVHEIIGRDQLYYISHSDKNNGSSYVIEYDQQLNEVRRFNALRGTGGIGYRVHYLAFYDDGSIFISNGNVTLVFPDFTSFMEIVRNIYAFYIYYDRDLKLLGAIGLGSVKIYNVTRSVSVSNCASGSGSSSSPPITCAVCTATNCNKCDANKTTEVSPSSGKCATCKAGYTLQPDKTCEKCPIPNCATCNSTHCKTCIYGYLLIDPPQCIRPPSQSLTTISPVAYSIVLFEDNLYTVHNVTPQDIILKVHNALTGSFLGVISTPRVNGQDNNIHLAVCRKNSQLFATLVGDVYYADISQIESNLNIVWQKLLWFSTTYYSQTRYMTYFQISDDCQEVFLILAESGIQYEVQIRRLTDGQLLAARNLTTLRAHSISGRDQRYYISHSDVNNGSSYVIEYDQQLTEVRRYTKLPASASGAGSFVEHYVASFDKGGVLVASARLGKVILVSPDFMSFIEVVPIVTPWAPNVNPWGLAYDPERKLLAAEFIDIPNNYYANIYNITIA